jgi:hypothetical protein
VLAVSGHGEGGNEVGVTFKGSEGLSDSDVGDFVIGGSDFFGILEV